MKLRWGIFAGCINEEQLIEAKIKWALRLGMEVSIVEGHHPNYKNVNEKGLSTDKTTEILKSYADQITYTPIGPVPHQLYLRGRAYSNLSENLDIVIMSDIDEFWLENNLNQIEKLYDNNKNLKLSIFNSYIFLDNKYCCPHVMFSEGGMVEFSQRCNIQIGHWHERIFRYNKFNNYGRSPFLINDYLGRFMFTDSAYFDDRILVPDMYMLHYKNFKMEEARKRHDMYKERGDKADYNLEWDILEKNKSIYYGNHPKEIQEMLNGR